MDVLTWLPRTILAIGKTGLSFVLPYSMLAPPKGGWGFHRRSAFEGYYTRIVDDAGPGGTLAIIFCRIDDAPERPYLLHLSYTPSSTSSEPTRKKFYQEWFPNSIDLISPLPHYGVESWSVTFPGLGSFEYRIQDGAGAIGEVVYRVEDLDLGVKFEGRIIGRTAWDERDGRLGPEGNLAHLDHLLGQHWFVYSTGSQATYELTTRQSTMKIAGRAHLEKNYGVSFPGSWIWIQGFTFLPSSSSSSSSTTSSSSSTSTIPLLSKSDSTSSLTLAGGSIHPSILDAFLIGYRSPTGRSYNYKPPTTIRLVHSIHLGTTFTISSHAGTVQLTASDLRTKLEINANAPIGSFMPLSCPLAAGHTAAYAHESFSASIRVKAFERSFAFSNFGRVSFAGLLGLGEWREVEGSVFENAALEFGGGWNHFYEDSLKKLD